MSISQNQSVNTQSSHDSDMGIEAYSLIDILRFLKGAYKSILIAGVIGLAIALANLAVTPKQYEAVAQIAMAQIGAANNNNYSGPYLLGVNIEEPSLLIVRLSSPTSFTPQVLSSCNMGEGSTLAKTIKLVPTKGVVNVVELKTFGKSPEAASICAQSIFELIKDTQAQIVAPYIAEAKAKLADDEDRLLKAQDLIAKADKKGQAVGAAYLATRDEVRYLLDEITSLKNVVTNNQSRGTRLITPIYASDTPIAPKRRVTLIIGLLGGLFLGLLLALGRQVLAMVKKSMQSQGVL